MTVILGTGDQTYAGTDEDDTVVGDLVFPSSTSQGNDTISGGAGDDVLYGDAVDVLGQTSGDDFLDGGPGDDVLYGDASHVHGAGESIGNDVLIGGPGDDELWGDSVVVYVGVGSAQGNDTFVFDFDVTSTVSYEQVTVTETQWVETTIVETFDAYLAAHDLSRTGLAQSQFSNLYGDWLRDLVARYHDEGLGQDVNGDGAISVGLQQNSASGLPSIEGMDAAQVDAFFDDATSIAIRTGKTSQMRSFSNEFSSTTGEYVTTTHDVWVGTVNTSISSGDGHDRIYDFHRGEDLLQFNRITEAMFLQYFTVSTEDRDGWGSDDTVITLTADPDAWSVVLFNVTGFDPHTDILFQADTAAS